jgi:V/A-type H+-transporting ATPase subunit B
MREQETLRREYRTITAVRGPLVFFKSVAGVALGDLVTMLLDGGEERTGQVIEIGPAVTLIQVFGSTERIDPGSTYVRITGRRFTADLSPQLLGRIFSGAGVPIDGLPAPAPIVRRDVNGAPINPVRRAMPRDFIQTGISAIDGLNTLVRGQKLPIFSGAGLPANEIAATIIANAGVEGEGERFALVFAGMGITSREADFFIDAFTSTGAIEHSVVFVNVADDPVIERLITPRYALTVAEYLAFDRDMNVLVAMTDMTHYCNALREISSSREEIPGRRGYPGYTYTDLASIYERAGKIKGRTGSVTLVPILTMPDDDITHPIPDLTGYITEGQIVLDRGLHRKGIFPPINPLPSLSRLMNKGIGEGRTRVDHRQWADQLYMLYARGEEQRRIAAIIGEEGLAEREQAYVRFAEAFEKTFIHQGDYSRTIGETFAAGYELLAVMPKSELVRLDKAFIEAYLAPTAVKE